MSPLHRTLGLVRAAAAGLVCLVLSGCWWQQPGAGPENTRHNAFERTLRADNVASLTEKWSVQIPGAAPEPVTSRTLLYVAHNAPGGRAVSALDIATGTTQWRQVLPVGIATEALPVAYSHRELWVSQVARSPFSNPECADISRLDPATGEVLGTQAVDLPTTAFVTSGGIVAYIDSARCTIPPDHGARLVVLDRSTSAILWTGNLGSSEIYDEPIIADGRIYAGGLVFDADGCGATTCSPLSTFAAPLIATGGRVYAIDNVHIEQPPPDEVLIDYGAVRVHSSDTGEEIWRGNFGAEEGPRGGVNGITVDEDTLYAGAWLLDGNASPGRLAAYPAAGCGATVCDPTWTAPAHRQAGQPAVAGDVVYTLSPDGLTAYDADGCGASTCDPVVDIPENTPGRRNFIVSAGHVFLVNVTDYGTPDVSTTITAYGLP